MITAKTYNALQRAIRLNLEDRRDDENQAIDLVGFLADIWPILTENPQFDAQLFLRGLATGASGRLHHEIQQCIEMRRQKP